MELKRCSRCTGEKPISLFNKNRGMPDGLSCWCKQCKSQDAKNRRISRGLGVLEVDPKNDPEGFKTCRKCRVQKPYSDFNKSPKSSDGLFSWCKNCKSQSNETWRRSKGEKPKTLKRSQKDFDLLMYSLKICADCLEPVYLDHFYSAKNGFAGVAAYCKDCTLRACRTEVNRKKRAKSRQLWRKENFDYRHKHRLHQAKRKGTIKLVDLGDVDKSFIESLYAQTTCYYCQKFVAPNQRTADHKTPLSRGGLHTQSNLVMACHSCNSSKRSRTEQEFRIYESNASQ